MLNILNNDGSKLWNFQTSRSNTGISTGIWTRRICNYFNVQKVDLSLYKVKTAKAFKLSLYTVDYIRNKNLTHQNWYTKLKMQIIVVYWHYHTEVPQINIISCDAQVSSLKWQSLTLRYKKKEFLQIVKKTTHLNSLRYFRCECLERWCFNDVLVVLPRGDRHPINSRRDTALRTALRRLCSVLLLSKDSSLSK